MKIRRLLETLLIVGAVLAPCRAEPLRQTFDFATPQLPSPILVEGRVQFVYELHCTNFGTEDIAITSVETIDAESNRKVASFAGDDLSRRLTPIRFSGRSNQTIPPGGRVVIFIEFADIGPAPRRLVHRLTCRGSRSDDSFVVTSPRLETSNMVPSVLGPPVRGGPWVAVHHPDWPSGHRRVFYAVAGRATLPGRYAIDWVKVDRSGRTSTGDPDEVKATLGYGAEVLAVADGVIADVRDDLPESTRISTNPPHPLGDGAGNFISLQLPDGRFAIYEHLQPGSLRVKPGDRVHRGDILGKLGFSGDSTGPHLHLHVADLANPLAGEGTPYCFDAFTLMGRYADISDLGKRPWSPTDSTDAALRRHEYPDTNVVVTFPE